ncbi:hypothetical protein NIES2119_25920 [[Phormidium ambiguum] IAM M-71]|uniref:DUF1508 domain-containing protein n=1 Tax=[Phormidium ambiguum] IAM M-71 TaxID=454136 RepID=A0A1U7I820_9CYAN|nr:hypothetical protein [Phormidium ambiguum]OKH32575.1 hypothetical protein NIES2119_25920 [Phormidium ambiguum IAM M-71]
MTKVDSVVGIRQFTLAVYYTASTEAWQFRILSPGGEVFGLNKIYFSPQAAFQAGLEWIGAGS